jgi:hypothetical protein
MESALESVGAGEEALVMVDINRKALLGKEKKRQRWW